MKQIAILIPTLPVRIDKYARLIKELNRQIIKNDLIEKVQIVTIGDTKDYLVGKKRNFLLNLSLAKYVCFIDDDDFIAKDYVVKIYSASLFNPDCVSFLGKYTCDGHSKIFDISISHEKDYNEYDRFYRIPNHLSLIKRDIALKCPFPCIQYGEDSAYSNLLKKELKTEYKINEILYFYNYNQGTSQTNKYSKANQFQEKNMLL